MSRRYDPDIPARWSVPMLVLALVILAMRVLP